MSEQHRCPFCGSTDMGVIHRFTGRPDGATKPRGGCQECGADGPERATEAEAIDAFCWPAHAPGAADLAAARADIERLKARIAELEASNTEMAREIDDALTATGIAGVDEPINLYGAVRSLRDDRDELQRRVRALLARIDAEIGGEK